MKNNYTIIGDKVHIELQKGRFTTIIDLEDLPIADSFTGTWYANRHAGNKWYVVGGGNTKKKIKKERLHRLIMGDPEGMFIDHVDADTLNNTRSNLRVVTPKENTQNTTTQNKSGIRNVYVTEEGNYKVEIYHEGKLHYYGTYTDIAKAQKVAEDIRKKVMPYLESIGK